jgi:hypothetical protein
VAHVEHKAFLPTDLNHLAPQRRKVARRYSAVGTDFLLPRDDLIQGGLIVSSTGPAVGAEGHDLDSANSSCGPAAPFWGALDGRRPRLGSMAKSKPGRVAAAGGWLGWVAWFSAGLRVRGAARLGTGKSRPESKRGTRARRPAFTPPMHPRALSRRLSRASTTTGSADPTGSLGADSGHFPVPVTTDTAFSGFP